MVYLSDSIKCRGKVWVMVETETAISGSFISISGSNERRRRKKKNEKTQRIKQKCRKGEE